MIHKHKNKARQNNMYVCTLHEEFYGIIGTYRGVEYDKFVETLQSLVEQFGYSNSREIAEILRELEYRKTNDTIKSGHSTWIFKILVHPSKTISRSYGRYASDHQHADAYNCYIKEERYFGAVEDIRQLDVIPVKLSSAVGIDTVKYT